MTDATGSGNSSAMAQPRSGLSGFYGWRLLAVFWLVLFVNLAFPMTGGSLLVTAMARDLGFSREQLSLPFSVYFGMIGIVSPLAAWLILRLGIRWTLMIGNFALALGALAMATLVHDVLIATICFGGLVGFAVSTGGNLTTQTAIPRWFVRFRARSFAIILTASAAGGVVVTPLLGHIIGADGHGWRGGWWLLSVLATGVVVLVALTVREYPSDVGQYPDGASAPVANAAIGAASAPATRWSAVICTWRFAIVAFGSFTLTAALSLFLAHGAANALDQGHSPSAIALALATYALTGFLAKVIIAIYGDRWNPAVIWAVLFLASAAMFLVAAYAIGGVGIHLYAVLAGIGLGGGLVCPPATAAHLFEGPDFARAASGMFLLQSIAGVAAPLIAGAWFGRTGSYVQCFTAAAALCVVTAVVMLVCAARYPRRPLEKLPLSDQMEPVA